MSPSDARDYDPLILAFDTSTGHCAAAIVQGGRVIVSRTEPMERGQAERLLPMLEEILVAADRRWPDLKAIAVAIGPGNFTGVRIAVAAARGLALALDIPAVGVSRLEAMACGRTGPVLATLDARRGEVYAQRFQDGDPAGPPFLAGADDLPPADARIGVEPSPADFARVAAGRLHAPPPPAPLYLRAPDAAPPSEAPPAILDDA